MSRIQRAERKVKQLATAARPATLRSRHPVATPARPVIHKLWAMCSAQSPNVRIFDSLGNAVAFQQAVKFPSVDTKDASGAGLIAVLLAENRDDV